MIEEQIEQIDNRLYILKLLLEAFIIALGYEIIKDDGYEYNIKVKKLKKSYETPD